MLAGVQSRFLSSAPFLLLLAVLVIAFLPLPAQINGVPASVTSYGFGGLTNPTPGVRASVTSLGPNGYGNSRPIFGNCCAHFFLPQNPSPPLFFGRRHHGRGDQGYFPVGVFQSVYVPYAVPYAVDVYDAEDEADDVDYLRAPGPRKPTPHDKHAENRNSASKADSSPKSMPAEPDEEVIAQPSTVLVFKDGHQSDILNYAIVGDTLFDFGAARTRKILLSDLDLPATHKLNEERGVDFQIPPGASRQ
jgi:hypothetical protein